VGSISEQEEDAKRPFPPLSRSEAGERLQDLVAQSPHNFHLEQTRWTVAALRQSCQEWLRVSSEVGLWRILQRMAIHYKRGRLYVHSPDPNYLAKRQRIRDIEGLARRHPDKIVLLYGDEVTYTRSPALAQAYARQGKEQPLAQLGYRANYEYRILAAVNALSGRVHFMQRNHIRVNNLVAFWQELTAAYPQAEQIYLVLDNWPVHYHADALVALQPQPFAQDFIRPAHWSTQSKHAAPSQPLPLVLVPLPTYASWLNPIEKLWRWLRQSVLHLHPYEDDSDALKAAVATFLNRFAGDSPQLLHYIGLLPY
jgi:transposase